jgi:hypothetical protein
LSISSLQGLGRLVLEIRVDYQVEEQDLEDLKTDVLVVTDPAVALPKLGPELLTEVTVEVIHVNYSLNFCEVLDVIEQVDDENRFLLEALELHHL